MRWHIGSVQAYSGMYAFQEKRLRDRRHADNLSRVCHSFTILMGSEQYDFAIRCTMCFLAFKCLLPIVKAGGHSMNAEIGIRDKLRSCPLSGLLTVMGLDMTVNCNY